MSLVEVARLFAAGHSRFRIDPKQSYAEVFKTNYFLSIVFLLSLCTEKSAFLYQISRKFFKKICHMHCTDIMYVTNICQFSLKFIWTNLPCWDHTVGGQMAVLYIGLRPQSGSISNFSDHEKWDFVFQQLRIFQNSNSIRKNHYTRKITLRRPER